MSHLKTSAVAFVFAATLVLVPAGTPRSAPSEPSAALAVNYLGNTGQGSPTLIYLVSDDEIARAKLVIPRGYRMRLNHAPGTKVGTVQSALHDGKGVVSHYAWGDLVVGELGLYSSDPAAQACAPGSHSAVWILVVDRRSAPLRFLIFVDRPGTSGGSRAVLHICPSRPTLAKPAENRFFELWVEDVFRPLTTRGRNIWRAFVSPPLPSLEPDDSRTVEARAVEPMPQRVTTRGQQIPNTQTVLLSGRVEAAGAPEHGAHVALHATTDSVSKRGSKVLPAGHTTTNRAGEFTIRQRATESTTYRALVDIPPRPCRGPSIAPAGCAFETVSWYSVGPAAFVRVRPSTAARLRIRSRDQALARRSNLALVDLRPGWSDLDWYSLFACRAFRPRLSALTATGYLETGRFQRGAAAASSRATVYLSEEQATRAFAREAGVEAVHCLKRKYQNGGFVVQAVRDIPFAGLGDDSRWFRIVLPQKSIDFVTLREGRTVVQIAFEATAPSRIREAVASVAARASNR